ncbi:type IV secretion system protein VirB5 [Duganella sp. SG902]|uniref:P-type DNA transfer protein VirB5 n=1 Tax=Duganella sp. SG902 TaxID=2587016 RepID=UPI00159D42DA|nr:P-type DNA transfer protein VirB5 [Duganella sp. SG902]NVM77463.1 type IV secretion system protein VirB5 [Duganella sp. SG902]
MKPTLIAFGLAWLCASVMPAHAQFAVIDVANLTQALQQVSAWQKQFQQMNEQKNQLQQQYRAATGNRGLGDFADDPRLRAIVPSELQQLYDALQSSGSAGLSASASAIRGKSKIYDCENLKGSEQISCQRLLNMLAQHQALLASALNMTSSRSAQIQTLQARINATDDPKSIAELQARLQAENIQVNNDANRLQLMRSIAEAADRAAEQAAREKLLLSLSRHNDGSDSFHFVIKPR